MYIESESGITNSTNDSWNIHDNECLYWKEGSQRNSRTCLHPSSCLAVRPCWGRSPSLLNPSAWRSIQHPEGQHPHLLDPNPVLGASYSAHWTSLVLASPGPLTEERKENKMLERFCNIVCAVTFEQLNVLLEKLNSIKTLLLIINVSQGFLTKTFSLTLVFNDSLWFRINYYFFCTFKIHRRLHMQNE